MGVAERCAWVIAATLTVAVALAFGQSVARSEAVCSTDEDCVEYCVRMNLDNCELEY